MTVNELLKECTELIKAGAGDKRVVLATIVSHSLDLEDPDVADFTFENLWGLRRWGDQVLLEIDTCVRID
jgi:hypothetical protein